MLWWFVDHVVCSVCSHSTPPQPMSYQFRKRSEKLVSFGEGKWSVGYVKCVYVCRVFHFNVKSLHLIILQHTEPHFRSDHHIPTGWDELTSHKSNSVTLLFSVILLLEHLLFLVTFDEPILLSFSKPKSKSCLVMIGKHKGTKTKTTKESLLMKWAVIQSA